MKVKQSKLRLAILLGMAVSCTEMMAVPSVFAETLNVITQADYTNYKSEHNSSDIFPTGSDSNNTIIIGSKGGGTVPALDTFVDNEGLTDGSEIDGGNCTTNTGTANYNTVTVYSGSNIRIIAGGNGSGSASNNTVTINGGSILADSDGSSDGVVFGGWAEGDNNNNTVIVNGGTVYGAVGGDAGSSNSDSGNAIANTVIINGGTVNYVEGGEVEGSGVADSNTVTINGGTVAYVFGGMSVGSGNVTNNTVTIKGGTVNGFIMGGFMGDDGTGVSKNNTVIIDPTGNLNISAASIYGSGSINDDNILNVPITHDKDSSGNQLGNTLDVYGKGITAKNVANFTNINFYLPSTIQNKDTVLTLTDTAGTDVSYSTVKAGIVGNANISAGDKIYLLTNTNGLTATGTTYGKLTEGVSLDYDLDVHQDGNSIVATIDSAPSNGGGSNGNGGGTIKSQTKSLVETRTAAMGFLNSGADSIDNVILSIDKGTYEPFVQTDAADMRYNTGSYSNVHGSHAMVGASRAIEKADGNIYLAPFVEAGWGRYDSHFDGIRADGSIDYCGVGFMARRSYTDGLYYEGTLHYGKIRSSYNSNDLDGASNETYDLNTPYYGINLEVGRTKKLNDKDSMDVYGKYFYTRQSGDTANLSSGETYNFDNVTSNRVRVGARWTRQYNTSHQVYAGAAYEYEFSGSADADYRGYTTPDSSLKGSSGMFEAGYEILKNSKHPMSVDLALTGWVGKQQGIMPRASVKWYL